MQPVPKAVHRSGCRNKHNWQRPLTLQSIMPSLNHCDLQRHGGVNNLPKVVTRQRRSRKLNSQPWSCKSNAITTMLLSHPLQEGSVPYSDTKMKADILNHQFASVFTDKGTDLTTNLGKHTIPDLDSICVSCPGVIKLLKNLKPHQGHRT